MSITHHIAPEHLPLLARYQHVLEWLQAEQARIQQEAALVAAQGQRAEAQLRGFLLQRYGIAPTDTFTLDAEAATVTTPDDPPETPAQPTEEASEPTES